MGASRRTFLKLAAAAPALALPPGSKPLIQIVAGQFRTDYLDSHAALFGAGGFRRLMEMGSFFPDCRIESTTFTASGLATIAAGAYPNVHGIVADRWYEDRVVKIGFVLEPLNPPPDLHNFEWHALGSKSAVPMRSVELNPAKPADFANLWRASPLGLAAEFTAARERPGQLVLESFATLGYETGADSPLVFDLVTHLDRQLESFLAFLDSTHGKDGYHFVFTAAHGAPALPANAIHGDEIAKAAGSHLEAYLYPYVYLKPGLRREDRLAVAEALHRTGKVNAWYTADGDCSHTGDFRRRMENSFFRGRSGDVMVAYPPGAVEFYGDGRGISYGSIYNYDARVPLFFLGPRFRAQTFEQPVELIDIAPTLARATGAAPPPSSTGRVLGEAFR